MWIAQVAELVDAIDSKSIGGNIMRVQVSPWALRETLYTKLLANISYMRYCVIYAKTNKNRTTKYWVFYKRTP